ncbi:hypothetical protein Q8A67_020245 [Cirrhinus molitorella]|uniref:Uncharacterized protein n=1 Tax=Cirrhinus molitorella TaxID=172907 RepID=A0AA88PCB7_9TELE|nr:hypothetical protein Q8A67_020245 [Cirrhinus molitorella]
MWPCGVKTKLISVRSGTGCSRDSFVTAMACFSRLSGEPDEYSHFPADSPLDEQERREAGVCTLKCVIHPKITKVVVCGNVNKACVVVCEESLPKRRGAL